MTAEYMPAWIIVVADVLVVVLVVLSCRLSNSDLKGVPRELVMYVIATSFIVAMLLFLSIALDGYGLARCHVYVPTTTVEHSAQPNERPFTAPQELDGGTDPFIEAVNGQTRAHPPLIRPEEAAK